MLMGSVTMAFPAMSQVMTGHRGTNSGQSSGMGAPAVERKSSNRSMMGMPSAPAGRGSGNNIERRMQSAPQQQSGSRSSAFGGGRVFGSGNHNAMQSSPASEARRETLAVAKQLHSTSIRRRKQCAVAPQRVNRHSPCVWSWQQRFQSQHNDWWWSSESGKSPIQQLWWQFQPCRQWRFWSHARPQPRQQRHQSRKE